MQEHFDVLVNRRALCGEGPLWDPTRRCLYWVDIPRNELHIFDPRSGEDQACVFPVTVGAIALTTGTEFIAAAGLGFALLDPETGKMRWLADVDNGDRMNDGACDPAGRFLGGTLTFDRTEGASALYRLAGDKAICLQDGMTLSNGIGWSPDGSIMYLIDTADRTIWTYNYDSETGQISGKRPWVVVDESIGNPDGLAVDAEGGVWVAMHWTGNIHRYSSEGTLVHALQAPTRRPTSLAFGGTDLRDVYVTSACFSYNEKHLVDDPNAGALFRFRSEVPGLPTTRWSAEA